MKPHFLWGFILVQIVCKGHQRSSKFTASGLRVNIFSPELLGGQRLPSSEIANRQLPAGFLVSGPGRKRQDHRVAV